MQALTIIGTFVILAILYGLLLSLPVMLLWNYCLVPAVSGLGEIGWLQAWGILILANFLFKSHTTVKKD